MYEFVLTYMRGYKKFRLRYKRQKKLYFKMIPRPMLKFCDRIQFIIFFSHIYVVDFTPDDRFLLSGSADETVMIWSLESLFDDLENEEGLSKHQSFSSLGQTFDQKFLDDNVSILAASDDNQTIRVSNVCNAISLQKSCPPNLICEFGYRFRLHSSDYFLITYKRVVTCKLFLKSLINF